MNVSVPKETAAGERRVALVPEVVERLAGSGLGATVEAGAGASAHHHDDAYVAAGASVGPSQISNGTSGSAASSTAPGPTAPAKTRPKPSLRA